MSALFRLTLACLLLSSCQLHARNHILMIVVDDLNDFVEPLAVKDQFGNPLPGNIVAQTPNMQTLANQGLLFTNAHSNAPVCNPSRSSMMHGVLPSTARFYGFEEYSANPVFGATMSLPKFMNIDGAYRTFFTGKTFHVNQPFEWERTNGIKPHQSPFLYDRATDAWAPHPDYPIGNPVNGMEFYEEGIDGLFGSLASLNGDPNVYWYRQDKDTLNRYANDGSSTKFQDYYPGAPIVYDPARATEFYYVNDDDRDLMVDELSAKYMQLELDAHFANNGHMGRPFFFCFGIMNPHTPLVAPQKYFDLYPLEDLDLSFLADNGIGENDIAWPDYENSRGNLYYQYLTEAYRNEPDQLEGIKKYLQAYLACTTYADDIIGEILLYLNTKIDPNTGEPLANNTTIILTADHGYHLGQKDYAWKFSMWDDSTRVPMIIYDPRYPSSHGQVVEHPVSLVDIYPTVVELGEMEYALDQRITGATGVPLDGTSLVPFLEDPNIASETWGGMPMALSMQGIFNGPDTPRDQYAALRSKDFRYIRYGSAKDAEGNYLYEEFYDYRDDPLELNNRIDDPAYALIINQHRVEMNKTLSDDPIAPWIETVTPAGEQLVAGFHSVLKGAGTASLLAGASADETSDAALSVSISQGPSNNLDLSPMLAEVSADSTYGDTYAFGSAPINPNSSIVMDGQPANYLLFHFQNNSARSFKLSSIHLDAKFAQPLALSHFNLAGVPDPSDLMGNGLAPKHTDYAAGSIPSGSGNGQFDSIFFSLGSAPEAACTLDPGESAYFMLEVFAAGWPAQALSYVDNLAWGGVELGLPLAITQQPANVTVLGGETANLLVDAQGDNLSFQWYRGLSGDISSPVEGQTSRLLSLDLVSESDEGSYWVRVDGSSGQLDSQAASLSVDHPIASATTVLAAWNSPTNNVGQIDEPSHLGLANVTAYARWGRRVSLVGGNNSTDNSFGTLPMEAGELPTNTGSFEIDRGNASNRFTLDLTLTNNRADAITLEHLRMDYLRSVGASNVLQVIYTGGDLDAAANTILGQFDDYAESVYHNLDVSMASLADRTLGAGESANFQLNIGFEGTTSTLAVFVDNLAFTGTYVDGVDPTPLGVSSFTAWIGGFSTAGLDGEQDDPDGDGVSNLLEFALNGNPMVADSETVLPTLTSTDAVLKFRYYVNSSALRYTIEHSYDLINWTEVIYLPGSLSSGGYEEQSFLMTTDPGYIRLKVSP